MHPANKLVLLTSAALLLLSACGPAEPGPSPEDLQGECDATHPKVGTVSALSEEQHGVAGQVEVVDDCTLRLVDFDFDGQGLDVRVIVAPEGDYANGYILTDDIRRDTPYVKEEMTLKLLNGITLDDIDGLSIWCLPLGMQFGEADIR